MIIIIIMNNSTQEMVELLDDYFVPSLSSLTKSAPNDFFFVTDKLLRLAVESLPLSWLCQHLSFFLIIKANESC